MSDKFSYVDLLFVNKNNYDDTYFLCLRYDNCDRA